MRRELAPGKLLFWMDPTARSPALLGELKESIRSRLRHLPGEGRAVLAAYRKLKLLKRSARSKLYAALKHGLPDPETVYWIDPARIIKHTNHRPGRRGGSATQELPPEDRVFDTESDRGRVYGGDWDLTEFTFDELEVARALRARIDAGADWHTTQFHSSMLARLRRDGRAPWCIESERDLEERYQYLDALIASIRDNGFRRVHEIVMPGEHKGLDGDRHYGHEISVNIDRNGHYLFQDGRHRLAIAKALRLTSVPVKVIVRHKKWTEFRQFVLSAARSASRPDELYQNPVHPDLQDIPASHECEDRFAAIRRCLDPGAGALLDIGASLAFFCHRFERLGYQCYAVESDPAIAAAAERIRIAEERRFTVICDHIFAASSRAPLRQKHFRVVLALNIFHHFLKREESFREFRAWLGGLDADSMFFQPHRPDESQMARTHVNLGPQQFVDFILENSCLRHAELINRHADGRAIYKLWR